MRNSSIPTVLPAVLAAALVAPAYGADVIWINGAGGSFQVPSNWSTGFVPGVLDRAILDLAGSRTVSFSADAVTDQLRAAHGAWSLDLNGHTYTTVNPEPIIVSSMSVQVGYEAGDFATLFIDGPGTLVGEHLVSGIDGGSTGFVQVRSGALLDLTTLRLAALGGTGSMLVFGGSTVEAGGLVMTHTVVTVQ